jgi:hypothetical protein
LLFFGEIATGNLSAAGFGVLTEHVECHDLAVRKTLLELLALLLGTR